LEYLKGRGYVGELSMDGNILKWILNSMNYVDWIYLAQGVQWWDLVNTVMNLQIP
jgi:hypothetical protein